MVEALIGGIMLFGLGLALMLFAQTMRRNAMQDPIVVQRQAEIADAIKKSNELKDAINKHQERISEYVEETERIRVLMRSNESRLARVTRNFRIVVEHGAPNIKTKRFDGSVFNRSANAQYATTGSAAIPAFFIHEVQIVIWAETLNEARQIFEKAYTAKDAYNAVFHGEIFGARS